MVRRVAWLVLLSLGACGETGAASLSWRIRFANSGTAVRASTIDLSIVEGSCNGEQVVYVGSATRDGQVQVPPKLEPGKYAFRGRAVADCRVVASGCLTTSLPSSRSLALELVLEDVSGGTVCTADCTKHCDPLDGGLTDGGPADASSPDAEKPDAGAEDPECPLKRPKGHCYRFDRELRTFADAEATCVAWGGHLVSFNDAEEELWVNEAVSTVNDPSPVFWIGFNDIATETVWVWTDKSTQPSRVTQAETRIFKTTLTPYTHWGPYPPDKGNEEPNDLITPMASKNGQDCATSRGIVVQGPGNMPPRSTWDDRGCDEVIASICEHP